MHVYMISVQQSQCSALQKPISADHNSTGSVYNAHARILNTGEIASITCLHNFSGPALLSCSEILTYQFVGSQLWIALPLKNSRSPATAMIEIASIACLNNFSGPALLSRSEILTYQLLGSQLWIALSTVDRHRSRGKQITPALCCTF